MADVSADPCLLTDDSDNGAQTIRIVGLFVILVASALGVWLPWLTKARGLQTITFFGTAFAAGIILATAFVHILPDGDDAFKNPCLGFSGSYPWASAVAGFSVLVVFSIEFLIRRHVSKKLGLPTGHHGIHAHGNLPSSEPLTPKSHQALETGLVADPDIEASSGAATSLAASQEEHKKKLVLTENGLAAAMLEMGIVFHSIFVGIDLGINTNPSSARALTIALVFHQAFEGLALGSALVRAECNIRKFTILALIFTFITPVGVAIGLGMGTSYNDNSKVSLGFNGAFNSVSAGILVYNGLVDLIVPLFMGNDPDAIPARVEQSTLMLLLSLALMFTGYCSMALIGKWA